MSTWRSLFQFHLEKRCGMGVKTFRIAPKFLSAIVPALFTTSYLATRVSVLVGKKKQEEKEEEEEEKKKKKKN